MSAVPLLSHLLWKCYLSWSVFILSLIPAFMDYENRDRPSLNKFNSVSWEVPPRVWWDKWKMPLQSGVLQKEANVKNKEALGASRPAETGCLLIKFISKPFRGPPYITRIRREGLVKSAISCFLMKAVCNHAGHFLSQGDIPPPCCSLSSHSDTCPGPICSSLGLRYHRSFCLLNSELQTVTREMASPVWLPWTHTHPLSIFPSPTTTYPLREKRSTQQRSKVSKWRRDRNKYTEEGKPKV